MSVKTLSPETGPIHSGLIDSPEINARFAEQGRRAVRNADWLKAHADEVYQHRGKYFCVAGCELFIGTTLDDALTAANARHPDDDGRIFRYVPKLRHSRI